MFAEYVVQSAPVKVYPGDGRPTSVFLAPGSANIRVRWDGVKPSAANGIQVAAGQTFTLHGAQITQAWMVAESGTARVVTTTEF